ncbi:AAA family ATPase [Hymenobacter negativus]|uniref:AAA family ATPase n=1 Tax=Hymenobacter negativus TaxID=2795026 RepID=A0ABS0QC04_9BACT|nr:AAA family ATPase [Hymenobacter negativus]MBH8560195.1 AAA family ATPase [Hymenobacter negativus]
MIAGVLLRNFKTYSGINYIPLSNGDKFCGLVGNNGIGKSSVLEALDSLFNAKPWNYNVIVKKSGFVTTRPHVVPMYLIKHDALINEVQTAKKISDVVWDIDEADFSNQKSKEIFKVFKEQRELLKREFSKEKYFLIPIGISNDSVPSFSIFNTKKLGEALVDDFDSSAIQMSEEQVNAFLPLHNELKHMFEYVYIPKDIEQEVFGQLENKEIQTLMGETLIEIIESCVPQAKIQEMNTKLNGFMDGMSSVLEDYSFRTLTDRQQNLKKSDVYKLVIEAYFKIRKLHKKQGDHWLDVSSLSSGEKQKAIIEIASRIINGYRKSATNLILAIDEPEASLHMSACYDQFDKLYQISSSVACHQLLFTTHWYGFMPTVEKGTVCIVSKINDNHKVDLINVSSYREEIKQKVKDSKGKLPYDIRLKSLNDFIQSLITSVIDEDPYNWLICEGSSEKIYFEEYFKDIIQEKKLRIIPVGGASEIKRIYNHLLVSFEDFKKDIKGKVILLSDTDAELVSYSTKDDKNLISYRMVNNNATKKTILVKIDSNPVSPKTEIEDALNGKLFFDTLSTFLPDYPEIENIIGGITNPSEQACYFSLDLSPTKSQLLENFFDKEGVKFSFAKKYVEGISDAYEIPEWIDDLKKLF